MVLPYASYLRVYEPLEQLAAHVRPAGHGEPAVDVVGTLTLATEQHTVLTATLRPRASAPADDDLAGCYLLDRDDLLYACPVDLAARSWLALTTFSELVDAGTAALFFPAGFWAVAEREYVAWRSAHPAAPPHIRQSTWGVPRTWFLLVTEADREAYQLADRTSVRYLTPVAEACSRLQAAYAVLDATIDDTELLDELTELGRWLSAFSADGWLELDYAGVAQLLGAELTADRSADDVATALRAIEQRDFTTAGEAYGRFVERWRAVSARERAS